MTDARFPDRWLHDRRLLRLSDSEFRTFVTSLTWCVSNRTDGRLEHDDLAMVPPADPTMLARWSALAFGSPATVDGKSWTS